MGMMDTKLGIIVISGYRGVKMERGGIVMSKRLLCLTSWVVGSPFSHI